MNRGMQCVALIPQVHGFHWLFNVFSHMFLNRAGYGRDELRNSFVSELLNRPNSLSKMYVYIGELIVYSIIRHLTCIYLKCSNISNCICN